MDALTVSIVGAQSDPVMEYAAQDLRRLLQAADVKIVDKNAVWNVRLQVDSSLPEYSFSVSWCRDENTITLSGYDPACVLHSVYTALEYAGYLFEITGPVLPDKLDIDKLKDWSAVVKPAVRKRGIRQHINFPMDISSYPLEEAREYIRNLARLRMNSIAFHCYPGMWYEAELAHDQIRAGGFFYGRTNIVPDRPVFKVVRNNKTFCIPSIEPFYDDEVEKSKAAIAWLQQVVEEAKRVGMTVQLSFEPRDMDIEDCMATAEAIVSQYPSIDVLELMTQETGGDAGERSVDELRNTISTLFSDAALKDEEVVSLLSDNLQQMYGTLVELGKNIKLLVELNKRWQGMNRPRLCAGVYCTEHDSLKVALALMRRYVPKSIDLAFMPAHGARHSAESVKAMRLNKEDLGRTVFYSWLEFDGNMFLQQNAVLGTYQILENIREVIKDTPVYGVSFNHWRTAENKTAFRYASLACIHGPFSVEEFYEHYAAALGVGSVRRFVESMKQLDEADHQVRNTLENIGFCFEPCWYNLGGKLGYAGLWSLEALDEIGEKFDAVGKELDACLSATISKSGIIYLEFLINRIKCTSVHLQAMATLVELQSICKDADPGTLDDTKRQNVRSVCDAAMSLADRYMDLHAQKMPDRGCEGTLVSYYDTVCAYIGRLKEMYGGEGYSPVPANTGADAPPSPAI
ncbi:MAG: hypothetical protein M1133_03595 [Armatimonadetes bacterium]|nr:hypothetical protein [Armatimonadota bacterium]